MNSRNILSLPSANPRNPELLQEMGLHPAEAASEVTSEPSRTKKASKEKEKLPGLEAKLVEKKIRVSSYFTPEEHWRLRMLALKQNLTVSDYLRTLAFPDP